MILDSLLVLLLTSVQLIVGDSVSSGWVVDSVTFTVNYEVEIVQEDERELYSEPKSGVSDFASRKFAQGARHPWFVTGWPLDTRRLHQQWGMGSLPDASFGVYSFSQHPLGSGWDLRLAVVHESVPTHNQDVRLGMAHGLF